MSDPIVDAVELFHAFIDLRKTNVHVQVQESSSTESLGQERALSWQ